MAASGDVPGNCNGSGFLDALNCGSGVAANSEGQTANTLFASIAFALASFGAQLLVFVLLRIKLARIYRPRSYLVPEKERVPAPPKGIVAWLKPLFNTPNLAFIQKCGLDAYFFLRYLRLLLKIFVPVAVVILPILLPINRYSGDHQGLDKLSISNVQKQYKRSRLWAHLILALLVILWVAYVVYRELRGYIRVRQAYLTSPQHRIKASATTVLVSGIPRKWLTHEALNGLYDVFPGGIRNIWINRNFDELADKVKYRLKIAKSLESAETDLIKLCRKKNQQAEEQRRKGEGRSKKTKEERQKDKDDANHAAQSLAQGAGVSVGDQHDHPHRLHEVLQEAEEAEEKRHERDSDRQRTRKRMGVIGDGVDALGHGLGTLGRGVGLFGRDIVGDVDAGFQKAAQDVDQRVAGKGFVIDDELYGSPGINSHNVPPTPPPKTPQEEREARLQRPNADRTNDIAPPAMQTDAYDRLNGATVDHASKSQANTRPATVNSQLTPSIRMTGPSVDTKRMSPLQIEDPLNYKTPGKKWQIWKNSDRSIALPSPQPRVGDEDEFPLNTAAARTTPTADLNEKPEQAVSGSKLVEKLAFWKSKKREEDTTYYPPAFNETWDEDQDGEPYWRRYLAPKDRETMRVPVFSPTWCPSIPLVGKKVDRIYWLRRELARLNLEIEMDQNEVEKFPFMNSAFIQFNHQVAAHMACQAVSHHIPQHMAPRLVEISPDDVIWENLSIAWWERYLRTGIVLVICAALIVLYAIPVTFSSLLSKLSTFGQWKVFSFITTWPDTLISVIQGVLPPLFLAVILALVPIIFRLLVKQQGVVTGTSRELGVQNWYFVFLFIQVFLVVTITGGLVSFLTAFANNPGDIVTTLATNLPQASTYFFSYLLIQALSNSAGSLVQIASLAVWFLLAPIVDSTARAKWKRQTTLPDVTWGSFFPPFTNFAVIGLVYSVIAPLILPFMIIIFGVFWIVYRYNVLYVYQFRQDTGGLLFPVAVNQLFVGLYFMELCLVGFFFLARDTNGDVACVPHAAIMIIAFLFTVLYQWLLNSAFQPLFRYLPITLEDEAVLRDEEFARAQASKHDGGKQEENSDDARDIQDVLAEREQKEADYEDEAVERERRDIEERRRSRRGSSQPGLSRHASSTDPSKSPQTQHQDHLTVTQPSWHKNDRWRKVSSTGSFVDIEKLREFAQHHPHREKAVEDHARPAPTHNEKSKDVEAQHTVGDVLFSGFADELEDLTPDERDLLVRYSFQHSALRAKRPVVWIPRDKLGVSDDEIKRAKKMSTVQVDNGEKGSRIEKTNLWMSNEGTALDANGKVVFRRSPPDFTNVDLIVL